ncbi:MAG: tyrosine-type recombinase/integrase, partial [Planctomycetota bacterium]|nr:tyrosine-type recombinase/integrase [Planctomycetota bacterium]
MPLTQTQSVNERLLSLPLGEHVKDFLEYLTVEAGLAKNTILAYGRDLISFLKYCQPQRLPSQDGAAGESGPVRHDGIAGSCRISELRQITPALIQSYLRTLARSNKDESSVKRSLVAIRMLLRFARLTGLVEDDFTAILEGPKLWQKLPAICSKQQVFNLINTPQPSEPFYLRDKAMLELLYATGIRASELAGLKTSSVNLDIGYLRCVGKGNRERVIPVGKAAIAATAEYIVKLRPKLAKPESDDFLLLSRTGRPLGRIDIWR